MRELKQHFIIPAVTALMLVSSPQSVAGPGSGSSGHGGQQGSNSGQSMDYVGSGQQQYQQKMPQGKTFKHQEMEQVRVENQQKMLDRNRNRVSEMNSHQVKAQQQVRNQQQNVKQEGVRLQAQQQVTAGLKNQVKEQQRLLQMESNRETIRAMNLNRAQVQNQLTLVREQRSQVAANEKLAREEKRQLQERLKLMSQQRNQLAEQERLLGQQQQQVEERLQLMTQQHEMLQQRERLWTEYEQQGS